MTANLGKTLTEIHRPTGSCPAEEFYCLFHLFEVDPRIQARAEGPLIRDAERRKGVGIDNSARQIPFARHRNDRLGPGFGHDLPGQRSTGRNEEVKSVFIGDFYQVANLASAASCAIVDVVGVPDITLRRLETVWKKEEDIFRPESLPPDEPVVQLNDSALKAFFPALEKGAEEHEKGIENLQHRASGYLTQSQSASPFLAVCRLQRQPRTSPSFLRA